MAKKISWKEQSEKRANKAIKAGDFKAYCIGITHDWLRTLMILIFCLVPIFFLLDTAMMSSSLLPRFAIYRGASALIAFLQFLIVINTKAGRYSFLHGYIASMHVGGMIVLMTIDLGGFSSSYYAGINLIVIAVNLLIPWGAIHTAFNALMVTAMYVGLNLFTFKPQDIPFIINNVYFLSGTIVIVTAINYLRFQLIKKEFSLLVQVVGARLELQQEKELLDDRNRSIKNLLDVSGQGFLSFDENFVVSSEYSRACENIFGRSIDGAQIDQLLFSDSTARSDFRNGMELYFNGGTNPEVIFDILESNLKIGEKFVETEYKAVHKSRIMVALTDITEETKMIEVSRRENEKWNILRKVISNRQAFSSFNREVVSLIEALKYRHNNYETLLRDIHTMKANAGFLGFIKTQRAAHELENFLSDRISLGDPINPEIQFEHLTNSYSEELAIVSEALGSEWYKHNDMIELPCLEFRKIHKFLKENYADQSLIESMETCQKKPLSQLMARFPQMVTDLASRFGKRISPVQITGGSIPVVLENYEDLTESFTHIIRNMVDHGIEMSNERVLKGKSPTGCIKIDIKEVQNHIEFNFTDDGKGLSNSEIAAKAKKMGLIATEEAIPTSELFKIIFMDNFSTKDNISEISGRGVGLSAVHQAVNKMGGDILVQSTKDKGTVFTITVPNINRIPMEAAL